MKKSNLLLLGTLATFLILLLGLHLMVAARFKSGQYKTLSDDAWMADFTWITLAPAKVIEVKDINDVQLYSAADAKWGYKKNNKDDFKSQRIGDTVRIWPASKEGNKRLHLLLDSNVHISARECNVTFDGPRSKGPVVLNATLDKASFSVRTWDDDSAHIDALNIYATNSSTINLHNGSVGKANISISNSRLISEKAIVQQMVLQADDASQLQVSAKQLRWFQNKQ